jgi:hypothetical protein
MKTRGLSRFFGMALLGMLAGGSEAKLGEKPPAKYHSFGAFHRRGKLKGWMKENRKYSFNKNK